MLTHIGVTLKMGSIAIIDGVQTMIKDNGERIELRIHGEKHKHGRRIIKDAGGESRTVQSEVDGTDINRLIERFNLDGTFGHIYEGNPQYGDFSNVDSYVEQMTRVAQAESQFSDLPAHLRTRFGNDVRHLIDFLSDAENFEEAVKLGLLEDPDQAEPEPEPAPAPAPEPEPDPPTVEGE